METGNPSVTKDKQFVAYVTQGPAAGAPKNPSGPEALMGRRQPWRAELQVMVNLNEP
jgi:hypothetical protein